VVLDRLDELRDRGNASETAVTGIHAARQIGGSPTRWEHIYTIEKNRRRARERDCRGLNAIRQQAIRHLDILTTQLGQRRVHQCPRLDPVRALINMKDLHAHTPVSLVPHRPGSRLHCPGGSQLG
jgi:hypothetical protein